MRCALDPGSSHGPAWRRLLLTGALLASCTCSGSSELPSLTRLNPLTEGASAHLPVPESPDGVLAISWFRGREAQPAAMIFSPEGLPGPAHTGRETLGAQGSLDIRNVTTEDSGCYTAMLETRAGHRRVTQLIRVHNSPKSVPLMTFPENIQGTIQSDLNYSVILEWVTTMNPEPVLTWTLNGKICGSGEKLFIRRLSREQLGTYVCTGRNSKELVSSEPVTVLLAQANAVPTDAEPIEPDPTLSLSGGPAIGLLVAGSLGTVALVGSVCYTTFQSQRTDRQRIRICC